MGHPTSIYVLLPSPAFTNCCDPLKNLLAVPGGLISICMENEANKTIQSPYNYKAMNYSYLRAVELVRQELLIILACRLVLVAYGEFDGFLQ
jgi:hypothetical protein